MTGEKPREKIPPQNPRKILIKPNVTSAQTKRRATVSAAGFRLKGGGWYETDFKSNGKRNLAGDSEPAGGAKDEGKGEAKGHGCAAGACGCATQSSEKSAAPA